MVQVLNPKSLVVQQAMMAHKSSVWMPFPFPNLAQNIPCPCHGEISNDVALAIQSIWLQKIEVSEF